ncbi:MAG: sulfite exporter TauE/SafE family protein [Catonella sp.]|uniref:sulfite exporter TauE/SafE family protein n=1 Tax=Catonella sp. TaxID=2382125 RepID=UPI003F9F490C
MEILFFVICFFASVIGAICGIGGGVIIKPLLDAFKILDVSQISFLSGCTVLSMSAYSVIRSKISKDRELKFAKIFPVAVGSAIGGVAGKWLFSFVKSISSNPNKVGAVQASCLLVVTLFTLLFTLFKNRIATKKIKNCGISFTVGLFLGLMSSFLGIGGGPINLVVLFYLFSMSTKEAVITSLYIIFISQLASLGALAFTNEIPDFSLGLLMIMSAGGILGGVVGRIVNKKIEEKMVEKLFIGLMVVIMGINLYNIFSLW